MKVYHGTSADNLASILEHGFDGMFHGEQVWTCSAGLNYFWNPVDLKRSEGLDTMQEAVECAKRHAKESAECSLGYAKDCRRVVFEVEIPKADLMTDTSCPNMDGAVVASSTIPPTAIKKIWIDAESLSALKGYFIAIIMRMDLSCHKEFTGIEKAVGKIFNASDDTCNIFELLSETELVEYSPLDNINKCAKVLV